MLRKEWNNTTLSNLEKRGLQGNLSIFQYLKVFQDNLRRNYDKSMW